METLFAWLWLIIQLLTILMVAAFIGDHIVNPILRRRSK